MSPQDTIEAGNRLIAEFYGWEFKYTGDGYIDFYFNGEKKFVEDIPYLGEFLEALGFHKKWDTLMMIIEKIQSINITPPPNYQGYRIEIVVQGYVKISGYGMPTIFTNVSNAGSLIKAVWQACVQFIVWYNDQNKQG